MALQEGWDSVDIPVSLSNIIPHGNRMLVRRRKPKDRTKGGIIIPDVAQGLDYVAYVGAVGPAVEHYKPGDWIILGRWNSVSMRLLERPDAPDDESAYELYFLITEEDAFAKLIVPPSS